MIKSKNPTMFLSKQNTNDINDALETAIEGGYISPDTTIDTIHRIIKKDLSLKEILNYDDYSSWGQWKKNELKNLSKEELIQELDSFRGVKWRKLALQWLENKKIPDIIIFSEAGLIGDGRGRVSLAVGMGITKLPVLLLE